MMWAIGSQNAGRNIPVNNISWLADTRTSAYQKAFTLSLVLTSLWTSCGAVGLRSIFGAIDFFNEAICHRTNDQSHKGENFPLPHGT